ncbi:telomere stability and silencing-domain-containing protein [Cunninghamella echinulata]|nr:telomere stability and silencing-domain-containing protein [Cunninghamella echinulata]
MGYHQLILNLPSTDNICLSVPHSIDIGTFKSTLIGHLNQNQYNSVYFTTLGGKVLNDDDILFDNNNNQSIEQLNLSVRLRGGKGGFGSMLRAQGGKMNAQKTTNFEACRDLQGRRIRTVNETKRLEEELAALPQREKEKRERLEKKIEKALKEREAPKYLFDDNEFLDNREQVVEGVKNAVSGLLKKRNNSEVASSSSTEIINKKQKTQTSPSKKIVSVFDDEDDEDEDEDDGEEEEEEEEEKIKEKISTSIKGKGKEKIISNISIKA